MRKKRLNCAASGLKLRKDDKEKNLAGNQIYPSNSRFELTEFGNALTNFGTDMGLYPEPVIGVAQILSCTSGALLKNFKSSLSDYEFGSGVAADADIDGSGKPDILIAAGSIEPDGRGGRYLSFAAQGTCRLKKNVMLDSWEVEFGFDPLFPYDAGYHFILDQEVIYYERLAV